MSRRSFMTAIAGTVLGVAACGASANTIFSETFESPVIAGSYQTYLAPGPLITGTATWTIGGSSVDIIRDAYSPTPFPSGDQAIDLNGTNNGSISTSITTTAGAAYSLSFYLAANSAVTATTNVGAGITSQTFTSHSDAWQLFSMPFVGAGSLTTISFASASPSGASGPTLDSVSVSTVPLPQAAYAGFGLLAGLGVLGGLKRRQRRLA